MITPMTFREMNVRVFAGKPIPHVLFQPRFEPWYDWQKRFGSLPERYRELGLRGTYDELRCSMRYVHYYTDMPNPVIRTVLPEVPVRERETAEEIVRAYETPYGDLIETHRFTVDGTWREVDFPVKGPDDLPKLRWLFQHMTYHFSPGNFATGSAFVGDRGEPQFWLPKSPYQALAQQWMKLRDLIYALADCPEEVAETMRAIDSAYDQLYQEVIAAGCVRIANFGEHIHDHLLSPRYFERYLVPWWEKRSNQLRRAGIYTHVHIDGYFRTLLKYLRGLPFDGLEALTPRPQGDVTLEQIKEHIGDKVLLDGIPAVLFLSHYSADELMAAVEQAIQLFHPRLVLGVSDEVPEGAPAKGTLEKIRMVAEYCRKREAQV